MFFISTCFVLGHGRGGFKDLQVSVFPWCIYLLVPRGLF
jgi:hypothetical protein